MPAITRSRRRKAASGSFGGDHESMLARAYDLVLNGVEIGGGSIRIHKKEEQMEMFRLLSIKKRRRSSSSAFSSKRWRWARRPTGASPSGSTAS